MFLTLAELSDQICNSPCRNWLSVRREQVSQGSQVTRNKVQVENRTHLISTLCLVENVNNKSKTPVAPHPLAGDAAGVGGPGVVGVEGELVPPQGRGGRAGQEGVV